jgi:hypothetical protein
MILKRETTLMSRHIEHDSPGIGNQSGGDETSMLIKIQRQLLHIEKKVDSLINMLQEKEYRGNLSAGKPYRKNALLKTSRAPGRSGRHRNEKGKEKSGDKGPDQGFYSKFIKTNGHPGQGSGSKPFNHKRQKRK